MKKGKFLLGLILALLLCGCSKELKTMPPLLNIGGKTNEAWLQVYESSKDAVLKVGDKELAVSWQDVATLEQAGTVSEIVDMETLPEKEFATNCIYAEVGTPVYRLTLEGEDVYLIQVSEGEGKLGQWVFGSFQDAK